MEVFNNVISTIGAYQYMKYYKIQQIETKGKILRYYFRLNSGHYNNPFERLINDICNMLGYSTPIIEYWIRDSWIDVECHQDIDECYYKRTGNIKTPAMGNILYLNNIPEAQTYIFDYEFNNVTMISPLVGKLVTFQGDLFHSVPKENILDTFQPRIVLLWNLWNCDFEICDFSKPFIYENYEYFFPNPKDQWNEYNCHPYCIPFYRILPYNKCIIKVVFMGTEKRRGKNNKEKYFYISCEYKEIKDVARYEITEIN